MPSENQPFQTASVHLTGQNAHPVRKIFKTKEDEDLPENQ
jgi:hypothetical protein